MAHVVMIETLKSLLKARKITYKMLGQELGLSESGVKKIFTAQDISIQRLSQIAEVMGLSLGNIIHLSEEKEIRTVRFTPKQESALHDNPLLFRIFWSLVVDEKSSQEIQRSEGLTKEQLERSLLKLENLDLVKLGKFNRVISTHKGLLRWANEGPLLKKLNKDGSESLLRKVLTDKSPENYHRLSYFRLSAKSMDSLLQRLNDLMDEFARRSQREKNEVQKQKLVPVRIVIAASKSEFFSS